MAWKYNLIKDMNDPSKKLYEDDDLVVLKDAYPKAEKHFLVLPRLQISNLTQVSRRDLPLLQHMDYIGREIANQYGGGRIFRFGYHADPSMERLHLHVISDDLNAPGLKHRRHWNNFTTPMFIDSPKVIAELKKFGNVRLPSRYDIERYLQSPMKCHKCDYSTDSMPALKNHLLCHAP